MTRRWLMSAGLCCAVAVGVPAIASLTAERAAAPAQISLNTAVPAFTVSGLLPGDTVTRCLRVRNEGDEAISLVDGLVVTGDLASHLRVIVEKGTGLGDVGPSCAGFRHTGFAYGTNVLGTAPAQLTPEYTTSFAGRAERSLRATVFLPADTTIAAAAKSASVVFAAAGGTEDAAGPPDLPGGIAPGTTGGFTADGAFLTNSQIKKRLRIGKARLLKNGNVVVKMFLPAGGAIRAKVILPNGVYYAHTLLPVEWGPTVRVLLKRRDVGREATLKARRSGKRLRTTVTTRYRWAHGPNAFVQPEQKLTIVKKRR